jgi:hypothetical protein
MYSHYNSEKLKSSKVLQLRKPTEFEGNVLQKTSAITMEDCYFIDAEWHLIDCRGVYLTDEINNRIRIE